MQPRLLKPLLVAMLLVAAGGGHASSLLELEADAPQSAQSTVVLEEFERKPTREAGPHEPPLAYPAPSFSRVREAEVLRLSPSMVGIGTPLPSLHSASRETTSAISRHPQRLPQVIRGGETGVAAPRQEMAPRQSQSVAAAPSKRKSETRPRPGPQSPAAAQPPPAPQPSGLPVGRPE
ncbi:hypothetical protein [uncultured Nitratireductor sp.]|uniref:hypothetical protein n=1 Tax=uncultured Nitratireductor sp. TaxID=520953 RepID=UPI0025DFB33B|nr:hypothetical protein [uncultured Nitratireductor sp.]